MISETTSIQTMIHPDDGDDDDSSVQESAKDDKDDQDSRSDTTARQATKKSYGRRSDTYDSDMDGLSFTDDDLFSDQEEIDEYLESIKRAAIPSTRKTKPRARLDTYIGSLAEPEGDLNNQTRLKDKNPAKQSASDQRKTPRNQEIEDEREADSLFDDARSDDS